jgi:hypothetical protein
MPQHGTVSGYTNLKCRCEPCRKAWREYMREYLRCNPGKRMARKAAAA